MRHSEKFDALPKALVSAQNAIGGAVKDAKNPFFKSTYADLNSVIAVLKPVYAEHGMTVIQLPCSDEHGVGVTTRVIHKSGEWLEGSFTLPLVRPDPQQAGSAITYAKRYALKALGLMPDLDDDGEAAMFRVGPSYSDAQKAQFDMLLDSEDALGLLNFVQEAGEVVATALHNSGEAGKKVALKKQSNELEKLGHKQLDDYAEQIVSAINNQDTTAIQLAQEVADSGTWVKQALWHRLTPEQQHDFKQLGEK